MTDSDWTRKIGALLRKAEGTDSEHEADAFLAKAHELMIRHAIDEQAAREAAGEAAAARTEMPIVRRVMHSPGASNEKGRWNLLHSVARACHVQCFRYERQRDHPAYSALVGFTSDVDAAEMLFASLLSQGMRFGRADWKQHQWIGKSAFVTSYLLGYAMRIGQRLRALEGEVVTDTTSTALIVRRDDEVRDAVGRFFPVMGKARTSAFNGSATAMAAGVAGGDRADIGQTRVSAGRARIERGA